MVGYLRELFNTKRQERVLEAVVKSSLINLLARGFGYFRSVAIAVLLGFSYQTDAFFMALSLIGIFLIFVDVFDSVGVPELVKARMKSEEEFKKIAGLLFTFTFTISIAITLLAFLLMPFVLKIPAGFSENALQATEVSYLILLPYLFFNFYFHHFGAVLRSQRRFTAYFVGEFTISITLFTSTLLGLLFYKDYKILPIVASLSNFIGAIYMLYAGREYIHFRLFYNETTKRLLSHFLQLLAVYGVSHLSMLVDRAFASFLGEKNVSALYYGLLLASAPRGVLKFENIAITSLSESQGSIKKLDFYIKKLLLLTLPISVFLFLFSPIVVKLFFGYGAFSKVDVEFTATALRFYALSLPFMFFWPLIYRVFQIRGKLLPVGVVGAIGVVANALFNSLFVFVLNLGIAGICLGTFFAYVFICTLGYFMLRYYDKRAWR